jgi:hypothetical protein
MNLKSYFGSLSLIFWALLGGQVLFLCVKFFTMMSRKQANIDWQNYLILIVLALAALVVGQAVARKRLSELQKLTDGREKLQQYRALSLIRWAATEAGTILMIVGFQLTGQPIFLGFALAFLFLFFLLRPTKDKITQEAQLSPKEVPLLDAEIPTNHVD